MKQGQIHLLKKDQVGKQRPVLVVSRDELNKRYEVMVVPFNGSDVANKRKNPFCVHFNQGDYGLDKECVANCSQLALIFKNDLISVSNPVGTVGPEKMKEIFDAINWCLNNVSKVTP